MKTNVLAQLNTVQSSITSTLEVCLSSNKVKELNQVLSTAKTQTTEALASVAAHPQKRTLTQTKKSLTVIDNLLSGLIAGLSTRELAVKDFRVVCSSLKTNFLPKFEEAVSTEVDKFKSEAGIGDDVEEVELTPEQELIRQAVIAAEVSEDEISEDEEDEDEHERETRIADRISAEKDNASMKIAGDVERRLARLRSTRKLLPERMKTPYSVVRLPVVPNFETESAKNPVLLEKLAIPFTEIPLGFSGRPTGITNPHKMERYVILEQQMILLISKDYVNDLLERKTEVRDEENSEEFGEHKARRKDLAARLKASEEAIDTAIEEFKNTPSQIDEIKRLEDKFKLISGEVKTALQSKYTPKEKQTLSALAELDAEIRKINRKIDKVDEAHRNDTDYKQFVDRQLPDAEQAKLREEHEALKEQLKHLSKVEKYVAYVDKFKAEVEALDKKRKPLALEASKIQTRHASTEVLKKKIEQIAIIERKLLKAQKAELARNRLIPNAERMAARMATEAARNEEGLKQKRKAVKRSGAPITPEDYARSIVSVMNERSGSKYALVTPIPAPNPRNSRNILCFWIMPSSKLSALMKATGGKAKVKEWDFPFEDERFERAPDVRTGWSHPSDRGSHLLAKLGNRTFKSLSEREQADFFKAMSPSDQQEFLEFLEFSKNAHQRPEGWKSIHKQARRVPE